VPLQDGRKHERYTFHSQIIVNNSVFTEAVDISLGGMYIKTSTPVKSGSRVTVTIPDHGLELKALVRFSREGEGMGLEFIYKSDAQRKKVEEIIALLRDKSGDLAVKPKVLLVEPQGVQRAKIKNRLHVEGFSVAEARDGLDAVKQMNNFSLDAVIMELKLAKISGPELIGMIRTAPDHKDKLIVVMSKDSNEFEVDQALDAGADHFVHKTDRLMEDLLQRLWAFLGIVEPVEETVEAEPAMEDLIERDIWSHDDQPPKDDKAGGGPDDDPWGDM
jgi:CheY-like chemotaxis protein